MCVGAIYENALSPQVFRWHLGTLRKSLFEDHNVRMGTYGVNNYFR